MNTWIDRCIAKATYYIQPNAVIPYELTRNPCKAGFKSLWSVTQGDASAYVDKISLAFSVAVSSCKTISNLQFAVSARSLSALQLLWISSVSHWLSALWIIFPGGISVYFSIYEDNKWKKQRLKEKQLLESRNRKRYKEKTDREIREEKSRKKNMEKWKRS